MEVKATNQAYKTFEEFESDVKLIISNSRQYHNNPKIAMYKATSQFETAAKRILGKAKEQLAILCKDNF